jgi:hypothetical protein
MREVAITINDRIEKPKPAGQIRVGRDVADDQVQQVALDLVIGIGERQVGHLAGSPE